MFPVRIPGALPALGGTQRQQAAAAAAAAAAAEATTPDEAESEPEPGSSRQHGAVGPRASKSKVKVQVRPFTKQSLDKHESRSAQIVKDYGFQPKRKLSVEDGSVLPCKYEPFPSHLYGKPLEEIDNFIYEEEEIKTVKEENATLIEKVQLLESKVDHFEMESRKSMVEVRGIPESDNENCVEIIKAIATKLDVVAFPKLAFRVGSKSQDRPRIIVADMLDVKEKEEIIRASRRMKINATAIIESWPMNPVFINENLTAYRRKLLFMTRQRAVEANYRYVWVSNGKIMARKAEGYKIEKIHSANDVLRL
ncbi:hypothetical protein GE061_001739 [Apolygus lucorum]|uniref:DUF4780 domain-containing protein n=1 Tax=Apolygus lucorum TaxID=248454 RepID=A0A8S9Y9W7_APOLU|nr:hypothetical protein GE061_001739 [Apolygus lucorum]